MKLSDLEYIPHVDLLPSEALFRVQFARALPTTVKVGRLLLPPTTRMNGRFDLSGVTVGYFAESPETAAYEALCRREVESLSLELLARRNLVCFRAQEKLRLVDLRPHARGWPVLQSLRISHTQELASEILDEGFAGIVYRSAQQLGMDCFAIFGDALATLKFVWSERLVERSSHCLHATLAEAIGRSRVGLVP